jgi:hypothetical protein
VSSTRITYSQRPDSIQEAETSALANVYRLVLDSAKKRGRLLDKSGPDDGTKSKEDSANEHRST